MPFWGAKQGPVINYQNAGDNNEFEKCLFVRYLRGRQQSSICIISSQYVHLRYAPNAHIYATHDIYFVLLYFIYM